MESVLPSRSNMPSMAQPEPEPAAPAEPAGRGLRLLSLDGGGVRGVSELYILEKLMERLKADENLNLGGQELLPCKVFDMICGTSTGGLIAIMLGRLRMSIKDCQKAYGEFAESVFNDPKRGFGFQDGRYKATNLKKAIVDIVNRYDKENKYMLDTSQNECKVFVCAMPAAEMRRPRRFRTYVIDGINENCEIWEAARASTAAPTYFKAAEITGQHGGVERFVDGGMGCNNPALQLCDEASRVYKGRKIDCVISIGTGTTPAKGLIRPSPFQSRFPLYVVPALLDNANDCEKTHEIMYRDFQNRPNTYFRFNVPGIGSIDLAAWKLIPTICSATLAYIDSPEIDSIINKAVKTLNASVSGRTLSQFPEGMGLGSSISRHNTFGTHPEQGRDRGGEARHTGASAEYDEIWLQEASSRPNVTEGPRSGIAMKDEVELQLAFLKRLQENLDSVGNTRDKKASRFNGTCEWFPETDAFKNWKKNPGDQVLIVVAPPGQGKSVLAKYLVEEHIDKHDSARQNISLDYFCHDSPNPTTALKIVQYFLYHLLATRRYLFKYIFQQYPMIHNGAFELQFELLWKIFVEIMHIPRNWEVFCIIDGVDECDPESQELLLRAIEKDFTRLSNDEDPSSPSVRFLLTSRPTALATRLGRLSSLYEIQNTDLDPDISKVIESEMQRMTRALILPEHLQSIVLKFLSGGAEGMFLWVALILERLNHIQGGLSVFSMLQEMTELPKSVEAIYDASIRKIKDDRSKFDLAEKILGTLFYSFGALKVNAFAIACNDWPDSCVLNSELQLRVDFRFEESSKEACDSLIRVVNGTIQFCHPTAAQYLLADNSPFTFVDEDCNLRLARTCIRYLLLKDVEIPKPGEDGIVELDGDQFPFLLYALQHWHRHLKRSPTFGTKYPQLLRKFLQSENGIFKNVLHTMHYFRIAFPEDNDNTDAMVVHALAFFELWNILEKVHFSISNSENDSVNSDSTSILLDLKTDVNARDSTQDTPLFTAVYTGSIKTIQTLLNLGANAEAVNEKNETVFHVVSKQTGDKSVAAAKLLIPLSQNLENRDTEGNTPLLLVKSKEIAEVLLENGADVNCKSTSDDGLTPLSLAAQNGNEDLLRLLLSRGANINYEPERCWTALHEAATQPNSKIITILLEHGAEIRPETAYGWNALHVAAVNGHSESVKILLGHVKIDCPTSDGRTSLHIAAAKGHESIIEVLLNAHADIEIADQDGVTPLQAAAYEGMNGAARALIAAGARVNTVSCSYDTPLTDACRGNHLSMVKLLLDSGANKDYTSESEIPMLQLAIFKGNLEIAEHLIKNNINLESTFKSNYTPLYVAAWQDHIIIALLLLDKGVNPRCSGENGVAALHRFAEHGREELVVRLLDMGLDASVVTTDKWTPLHHAAQKGKLMVAKALVARGASIGAKTSYGSTPLILASENGHTEVVEWLLNEKGADPNESTNSKWSPLHAAARSAEFDVVNMLLLAGASPSSYSIEGTRPLYEAARSGHMETVSRLLEADPDEKSHSTERWTPLSVAAYEGHLDVVDALLKAGADVNCTSEYANLAFHNALEKGHLKVSKLLLTHIQDPSKPNYQGQSPLFSAALGGNAEIMDIFLTPDIDVNQLSPRFSALHAAAENGNLIIINKLLDHGANIDIESNFGTTPLMLASLRDHSEAVERLLKAQGDPNKLSRHHTTPLHWAAWRHRDAVMKILLDYKADPLIRDCYGRSSLDWAQMYEPAATLMSTWQTSYQPPRAEDCEKSLKATLATTSRYILSHGKEEYGYIGILAHASFFLGKVEDAFVGFEHVIQEISKEMQGVTRPTDVMHNIQCYSCLSDQIRGTRFICKTCAETDLCTSCMDKYKEGTTIRGCFGHDFLEVPRPSWFKLAPGTVNEQGETLEQWLQRLYDTYKDEPSEDGEDISAPVPETVMPNVVEERNLLE